MKLSKSSFKKEENAERKISTAANKKVKVFPQFDETFFTKQKHTKVSNNSDQVKCLRKYHIILCGYFIIKKKRYF